MSPAVVVPNLILLRERGFGVAKGVPTLVLAVTGIEDAAAISAFGVIVSVMFSAGETSSQPDVPCKNINIRNDRNVNL